MSRPRDQLRQDQRILGRSLPSREPDDGGARGVPPAFVSNAALGRTLAERAVDQATTRHSRLDETVARVIQARRGRGSPLPGAFRGEMESTFGTDFSQVRVHADQEAHALNERVQARAFTTGSDIFFSAGAYAPASSDGQKLLGHELTHVVQQASASPPHARRVSSSSDAAERQAEVMGERVAAPRPAGPRIWPQESGVLDRQAAPGATSSLQRSAEHADRVPVSPARSVWQAFRALETLESLEAHHEEEVPKGLEQARTSARAVATATEKAINALDSWKAGEDRELFGAFAGSYMKVVAESVASAAAGAGGIGTGLAWDIAVGGLNSELTRAEVGRALKANTFAYHMLKEARSTLIETAMEEQFMRGEAIGEFRGELRAVLRALGEKRDQIARIVSGPEALPDESQLSTLAVAVEETERHFDRYEELVQDPETGLVRALDALRETKERIEAAGEAALDDIKDKWLRFLYLHQLAAARAGTQSIADPALRLRPELRVHIEADRRNGTVRLSRVSTTLGEFSLSPDMTTKVGSMWLDDFKGLPFEDEAAQWWLPSAKHRLRLSPSAKKVGIPASALVEGTYILDEGPRRGWRAPTRAIWMTVTQSADGELSIRDNGPWDKALRTIAFNYLRSGYVPSGPSLPLPRTT